MDVKTAVRFLLTRCREVANTLHVAYNTCEIINVLRVTMRAFMQVSLIDVTAVITDGVRYVECEVIASFLRSNA